ncbi:MAG: hypothetical protein CMJ18_01450 [Phycisphaeraceae bacterium]|nr:hypothetical protein [Phycisphaeraceae bacterium]
MLLPVLDFAQLSDVGRTRLANEDTCYCQQQMGLFVVCDGLGGRPSGEAASQITAHALGHLIRWQLRSLPEFNHAVLTRLLIDSATRLNAHLHHHSRSLDALTGMGATLVAGLVDTWGAMVMHVGDSRAYLLRGDRLRRLTKDHVRREIRSLPTTDDAHEAEEREIRLLTQFVGMSRPITPVVKPMTLEADDRLLLCTDGLTDPVDDATIARILGAHEEPAHACKALVDAANDAGGPDNISVIVVDYGGTRDIDPPPPPAAPPPARKRLGAAEGFYARLRHLEKDLAWLYDAAVEVAESPSHIAALAAVKQRLGHEAYTDFLQRHPSRNAAHVLHQMCTLPEGPWRTRYDRHLRDLEPDLSAITDGSTRLCPLLTPLETATILRSLWRDWRRVERRYFATCQRDALGVSERSLNVLIEHMLDSARTMLGLMAFFQRFDPRVEPSPG